MAGLRAEIEGLVAKFDTRKTEWEHRQGNPDQGKQLLLPNFSEVIVQFAVGCRRLLAICTKFKWGRLAKEQGC
jgi:hypothetical protein